MISNPDEISLLLNGNFSGTYGVPWFHCIFEGFPKTLKWGVVYSSVTFHINGYQNHKLALCLYTVMGWGVMSCVYGKTLLCGSLLFGRSATATQIGPQMFKSDVKTHQTNWQIHCIWKNNTTNHSVWVLHADGALQVVVPAGQESALREATRLDAFLNLGQWQVQRVQIPSRAKLLRVYSIY